MGTNTLNPWQLLVITVAGRMNRHQRDVIDYLIEESRVLEGQRRRKRVRPTDDERRRLAVKGKALGRQILEKVTRIVSPDTILDWYRKLVARKRAHSSRRQPGRPRTKTEISRSRPSRGSGEPVPGLHADSGLPGARRPQTFPRDCRQHPRGHPECSSEGTRGQIRCRERLGGMLHYQHRQAAWRSDPPPKCPHRSGLLERRARRDRARSFTRPGAEPRPWFAPTVGGETCVNARDAGRSCSWTGRVTDVDEPSQT